MGKVFGVLILSLVLVVGFQNCSPSGMSALDAGQGDIILQSSAERSDDRDMTYHEPTFYVDLVTPRIVLSDNLDGLAKSSFSPKQVIYGTVYGVSEKVDVCIGYGYCTGFQPADVYYKTYYRDVNKLANWSYDANIRAWRFTLDYKDYGDAIEEIVVYDKAAFPTPEIPYLRLQTFIRVMSTSQDPGLYLASTALHSNFLMTRTQPGNNFRSGGIYVKAGGLGQDLQGCLESAGSGRCATSRDAWTALRLSTNNHVESLALASIGSFSRPAGYDDGGEFTIYVKNNSGVTVSNRFTLQAKQVVCSMRGTAPVIGPCSDPEASAACGPSNVGQKLQGTGTCRSQYICQCS